MLSQEQIQTFERDGYTIVPNVLDAEQIATLRSYLIDSFNQPPKFLSDTPTLRADLPARHPETRFLLWNPKMVSALRSLLGDDFVYLPEMAAHAGFFSDWHKDTQSQEGAGHEFQWNDDYLMVEAAIYLQDNNEFGGGLDVVRGSHNRPVKTRAQKLQAWAQRKRPYSIPGKAGDLVIFHFRVDHRASRPAPFKKFPTGDDRKLAVFFACSRNNAYVRPYIEFLKNAGPLTYIDGHEYPEGLIEDAEERELTLAPA